MFRGKQFRATVLTTFLFAGVLIFHHIGGGGFEIKPAFALCFIASLLFFNVKPLEEFDGPNLALAILGVQALGHFMVGAGHNQSDLKMGISHLTASFLTFELAKHFDEATAAYEKLLTYLFPKLPKRLSLSFTVPNLDIPPRFTGEIAEFIRLAIRERAPPTPCCA